MTQSEQAKRDIWLVWEFPIEGPSMGKMYLRAVDEDKELALRHQRIAESEQRRFQTRFSLEHRQSNHLYGALGL